MVKLLEFLSTVVIIAAAMVNGQDYDESYSSWFDNPRQQYYASYYRPYYGCYYSVPPPFSYDYEEIPWLDEYYDDPNVERSVKDLYNNIRLRSSKRAELYPLDDIKLEFDFSCHGELSYEKYHYRGSDLANLWKSYCEGQTAIGWDDCYNGCMLYEWQAFNIMWKENKTLRDVEHITSRMSVWIFPGTEVGNATALKIATRIKDDCDQIAIDLAETRPCNSKAALYECVHNAMKCD